MMKKFFIFTLLVAMVLGGIVYYSFKGGMKTIQEIIYTNLITNEGFTLTLYESSYLDEVKPEAPTGFYNYYPKEENQKYLVVPVTLTNTSSHLLESDSFQIKFKLNQKTYSGIFLIQNEEKTNFVNQIQPGESLEGALITLVPTKLSETKESQIILRCLFSNKTTFSYLIHR